MNMLDFVQLAATLETPLETFAFVSQIFRSGVLIVIAHFLIAVGAFTRSDNSYSHNDSLKFGRILFGLIVIDIPVSQWVCS
jgi:hypothetical protein